jgi:glycosyltransferase involved in cell wall biosynthesis
VAREYKNRMGMGFVNIKDPLVSIATPVLNGEQYLSECINSVLAQTYRNWEHVILDNCSTDRTFEMIQNYANQNGRIRLHRNQTRLSMLQNWNHALRLMSPQSKYCKVLHADDLLFPDCVERMVQVGEANPSVGIIGAYRIDEDHVNLDAMPFKSCVVSGKEMGRRRLLGAPDMFGSPSSLMVRADLIRQRECFYNEGNLHADSEVCFDLLRNVDFGFVHQVLTYTRRHNEAVTSSARKLNTQKASHYLHLVKYGRDYLNDEEYGRQYKRARRVYYRFLGKDLLRALIDRDARARSRAFWEYHRGALADLGQPLSVIRLFGATAAVLYDSGLDRLKV